MADTYAAIGEGFQDWSPRRPIGVHEGVVPLSRLKLSSSSFDVYKGHPVINATAGTFDRVAVQGVNELQTLTTTGTVSGGTFTITSSITGTRRGGTGLTFTGTTSALPYNATAAQVQTALDAILGVGNCLVGGGPYPSTGITVTFIGDLSATNVAALTTTDSLTGSTPATVVTTTTGGTIGLVTSATGWLGFSEEWDAGTVSNWPRNFGQAPLNLEGPFATTTKSYLIYPDQAGMVYTGAIWPTEVVAGSMVNTSYSLGWNVSRKRCYIRTGDTSVPVVTIVGIPPGQSGVVGGLVDFIVKDGVSIFH